MSGSWTRSLRSLKSFSQAKAARCELCAQNIHERHQHLLEPRERKVICSCDGCAILFDVSGATRYRRIPRNASSLPELALTDEHWRRLNIPIGLGFIHASSRAAGVLACYPSPLGVTEASIDEGVWREVVALSPKLSELNEDVEALLVNRLRNQREYFRVPIDRCFELVGIVRTFWQGMSGGDRVWEEVGHYLSRLRAEAGA